MTAKNKELYNIIETLPEELSNKVLEYKREKRFKTKNQKWNE